MNDIIFILDYETFKENLVETARYASKYVSKIWFRIKNLDAKDIYEMTVLLRNNLPDSFLILSERVDIAVVSDFNGVHLNSSNAGLIELKERFPRLSFGYSAHTIEEIKLSGFDYFTLSPIFYTEKSYPVNPLGAVDLSSLKKDVYALGGLNSRNIHHLKNKGYKGVAGIKLIDELPEIAGMLNR